MVQESRTVPPQNCELGGTKFTMATCHGIILGAASPPTIRLAGVVGDPAIEGGAGVVAICIKVGMDAKGKINDI